MKSSSISELAMKRTVWETITLFLAMLLLGDLLVGQQGMNIFNITESN